MPHSGSQPCPALAAHQGTEGGEARPESTLGPTVLDSRSPRESGTQRGYNEGRSLHGSPGNSYGIFIIQGPNSVADPSRKLDRVRIN
jgi:hypothetical protein